MEVHMLCMCTRVLVQDGVVGPVVHLLLVEAAADVVLLVGASTRRTDLLHARTVYGPLPKRGSVNGSLLSRRREAAASKTLRICRPTRAWTVDASWEGQAT